MLHSNLSVNNDGHLMFAEMDTIKLAEKYGTPLYLMDEARIRQNCRIYTESMEKYFGPGSRPLFASKACCFKQMYRIMKEENMYSDVVSSGELYTALQVDFPAEHIFFHGNNKTDYDIEYAISNNIGYFIVDNEEELIAVNECAKKHNIKQQILLRLTPGIDPHTHKKISTGYLGAKFGVAIETGQADDFIKLALSLNNIDLKGYHCHVGSQIFDYKPFKDAADIMLSYSKNILDKFNYYPEILDLGGGFGVRYVESDPQMDYAENIKNLAAEIKLTCETIGIPVPNILLEPGRSIVADCGITLYTVGSVKSSNENMNYVSIDGGMTDNPRYTLYEAEHTVVIANRMDESPNFNATIAGRCCESGDLIMENVSVVKPKRGDIVATFVTGAYNYTMASNYNRIPRPPVVMIKNAEDYIAVRRESFEDLDRNDI